ncbi:hypothetical protein [Arthrobacter caoxuetaonis]|uniref:SseB protein N-terminal domain-containing protein n=1 Tax=Arthrobacter caoxuetaonis TaxID=2886935 RepID=A0A9X1MIZ9_9MICC|nr:hypothetical protein [Arthrobacter caoxuetaonis]MCC3299419.1 hypothetical protein [Arthrobacter caoxuetaonis]USQ59088.1 hypothetical protein NF551_18455 [Arthrobacter caoxuetaonis]
MTTKTELEQLDDIHEGFSILEGDLRCAITDIKEQQRTLELIILAKGIQRAFPEAVELKVAIREGVAVPLQLLGRTDAEGGRKGLAFDKRELLAWGRGLEKLDIEGWLLDELLAEISKGSDGSWINLVDALPDVDTDFEDPYRVHKTEFSILLSRAAGLPVPVLGAVTVPADRMETPDAPGAESLRRLRSGIKGIFPDAYMLYIRRRDDEWEAEELADETGLVLRSSEPLAAEAIPGGTVGETLARIPASAMVRLLTGVDDEELDRPGAVLGVLIDPDRR